MAYPSFPPPLAATRHTLISPWKGTRGIVTTTDSTPDVTTDAEALDALVERLDLATKVRLLTGETAFTLWGEESIGLAPMAFSDGPTGVRGLKFTGGEKVALVPNATLLAGAWRDETAHEVGELLADEAERQHIHVVLGPTINLHRSPLGGRLFEAYSEDPYLTGRLAVAYVRGLQGRGIGACLKHLVANESETLRNYMNSVVSEKALREVYLLPFEMAVEEAQPWSIMASYNDINGVTGTEQHHVNTEIVKEEWAWDGLLMSDWFATKSAAPAALGGLDLVMPGPDGPWGAALVADVESGRVPESVIDQHVIRLLRLAQRVGALGGPDGHRGWPADRPAADDAARCAQLRRLATDGMVVLKNAGGLLPLPADALSAPGSVALVGRLAIRTTCMGGGSAQVNPPHEISVAEGLRAALGDAVTVVDGVEVHERPQLAEAAAIEDPDNGVSGMRVRILDASREVMSNEHSEGAAVTIGFDDDLPRPPQSVRLSARLVSGGLTRVGVIGTGRWRITLDGTDLAELDVTPDGFDPGGAVLLPPSWSMDLEVREGALLEAECSIVRTTPQPGPDGLVGTLSHMIASGMGTRGLVAGPAPRPTEDVLADAVAAARSAEVAVVVVGNTAERETEAKDKSTLALPGEQDALVRAVAGAARRTVVVVNSATPVLMPWFDAVDAVLVAGIPGQEGGHAVADALLGVREPAGRLVTSWPAADGAAPAWDVAVTPTALDLPYTDDVFVGYRGFHAGRAPAPAHWLGEGQGYGEFTYADVELVDAGDAVAATMGAGAAPTVAVTVRNAAPRAAREVVQVYFQPADETEPVRLAGFAAVDVPAAGESRVVVPTDARLWRRWDEGSAAWGTLGGGALLLARGLGDVRARLELP